MSSFPSRMARRVLRDMGFTRERIVPPGEVKWRPGRVLDKEGKPYAPTWVAAAVKLRNTRK